MFCRHWKNILFKQGVRYRGSAFSAHEQLHAIQARQTPMGSEILIKPLSLWPEYSTSGLLILFKKP